ncbi:MAG: universal stress protein [Rubrivivax sp.]|nr:universal stress protein [Rubrivivax sp.]
MAGTFSRLLLATEHSEYDTGAEALAFAIARRCALPLAAVLPVLSNPEFEQVAPQLAAKADAEARVKHDALQASAQAQGVPLALQVRHGPEPYLEIVDEARERAADLIVIRRRGKRGLLANLLVGEMVFKVLAHAPCSVLVAPRAAQMWSRRVLVGIDPQAPSTTLLAQAAALAAECALPLRVVCVAAGDGARPAAQAALQAVVAQARALGADADGELRTGRPHQQLVEAAQACGADLLAVARHGGDSLARAWMGGTAQKVIGLAACAVLVHVNHPHPKADTT